jgi:hypothetical protein
MTLIRSIAALSLLVFALCPPPLRASPVFRFTLNSLDVPFSTPGITITGEIFGLPDNGTGSATRVVVNSITGVSLESDSRFNNLPVDLIGPFFTNAGIGIPVPGNQFVVQNDVITSAFFTALALPPSHSETFSLGWAGYLLNSGTGGIVQVPQPDGLFANTSSLQYLITLGTATYELESEVPEPSLLLPMLAASMIGVVVRYRSRRVSPGAGIALKR